MRTVKAWAVVGKGGRIATEGGDKFCLHRRRAGLTGWVFDGERIVRVEIREVPRKARREP